MSRPMHRLATVATLLATCSLIGHAITNGQPDGDDHPYVGELLFYVPDEIDSRFTDPGAWFTCSGTLVTSTVVVTAGHCSFAIGLNGTATTGTGGDGGNDVWLNFAEAPDFEGFPPSADYIPDDNEQRYTDRVAYLNDAQHGWIRATAYSHPEFSSGPFYLHDLGVIVLDTPVTLNAYGALPEEGYLDRFASVRRNTQRFTPVGYGLTRSLPNLSEGGDTRMQATAMLQSLKSLGLPDGIVARFTNNNGAAHQGGTCFGDSGGPVFDGRTNIIVAVTSFGLGPNCTGTDGAYRIDQDDDLKFITDFGVPTP